tara:strand:- start:62 stop:373 length:312 start_codon:yes stop_codon:yes gene_type:complete
MATTKIKGTNAKIKELKVEKPENISEAELTGLQTVIRTMDRLTSDVGRLELQKQTILASVQEVQAQIQGLRENFMKTYGTDNVNIQTGELAYPNKEENVEANS